MATTCKLIAKTVLTSSSLKIEFTSIPATYTDLLMRLSLRSDASSDAVDLVMRFNGATSDSGHSSRTLEANGNSASSYAQTICQPGVAVGQTATSNTFGSTEIYIPNYAGSENKSLTSISVNESNATVALMQAVAGAWSSTNAINAIAITIFSGANFVSGSSAYLYGITKA